MNLITTVEHAYAVAAQDLVKDFQWLEKKALPALQKVEATATTVEAITGLVDPAAVNVARMAYAVLAAVINALDDAGKLTEATLVASVQAIIGDIQAIAPAVKAAAAPMVKAAPNRIG